MKKVLLQQEPIDAAEYMRSTGTAEDGAVLCFVGTARKSSMDKEVLYLDYEVYEGMAFRELEKIVDEAMKRWPVNDCCVVHRYGRVNIAEASIFISVSTPHRDDGFKALRFIIDTIKQTVPIWKKETYSDGSVWVSERT